MVDFHKFCKILEAKKINVDMKIPTYTFNGKRISNLPKISPEQKEKLSKLRHEFKRKS